MIRSENDYITIVPRIKSSDYSQIPDEPFRKASALPVKAYRRTFNFLEAVFSQLFHSSCALDLKPVSRLQAGRSSRSHHNIFLIWTIDIKLLLGFIFNKSLGGLHFARQNLMADRLRLDAHSDYQAMAGNQGYFELKLN